MGATGGDESVDALRLRMLAVGQQLIAELAREKELARRRSRSKYPDDEASIIFKEWKVSRGTVDTLAEKYVEAIAEYRKAIEGEESPPLDDPTG